MSDQVLSDAVEFTRSFLEDKTGCKTVVGERDTGASEMPIILLILDQEMTAVEMGGINYNAEIPIAAKIRVERKQESSALDILERIMKAKGEFRQEAGYVIGNSREEGQQRGSLSPTTETSYFEISVPMLIDEII